jgi:thioredoxin 1
MKSKSVLSTVLTTILILTIMSAVASAYDGCSIECDPEAQSAGDPLSYVIDDILADGESVFLFFYADWCPHCHHQMPLVDELESEYAGEVTFIKINVTERPDHAAEFGVSALPTMIVISGKNGAEEYVKEEISGFAEAVGLRGVIAFVVGGETGGDADTMDPQHVAETMVGENTPQDGVTVNAKKCGGAITCACGDTVTSDYTLEDDLDCASIGLVVGATGIHIDGNGHHIIGTGGEFSKGIKNDGYDYVTISNLTISGFESGIHLRNAANYNDITDNSIATGHLGIYLADSNNNEIAHNYVHNNRHGVQISGGTSNTIRRNTIDSNTHYGIYLGNPASTSSNRIYSNALCGNGLKDIMVSSGAGNRGDNICDNLDVGGNSITCHTGCDERGCVADAHPATVFKCGDTVTESCTFNSDLYCSLWNGLTVGADDVTIDGDGYRLINSFTRPGSQPSGIKNNGHNNGTVMDLTIKKFYRGIYLYNHADGNKIKGCTMDDNSYGIYIIGSNNNQMLRIYKIQPFPLPIAVIYNHIVNNGKGIQ